MRLCACAQPAYMRMTRRRSVLPHPSIPTPREDNDNTHSEKPRTETATIRLERLDKGRSIWAASASSLARALVRASRAGPLVAGRRRVDPHFLAERARDPSLAPRVLVRLAPQPLFTPPWPTTIEPCPLSEPDVRLSRIRLPATRARAVALEHAFRGTTGVPSLCTASATFGMTVMASPPSLHPSYQASSVLRSDPTSTPPSARLTSSARPGILPAEEQRGSPWLPPRHHVKLEPASDPGRPCASRH